VSRSLAADFTSATMTSTSDALKRVDQFQVPRGSDNHLVAVGDCWTVSCGWRDAFVTVDSEGDVTVRRAIHVLPATG
jgi:hypothetical protein